MKQYVTHRRAAIIYSVIVVLTIVCQLGYGQVQEMSHIKKALPAVRDSVSYVNALNRLAMLSHLRYRDSCLLYATKARGIAVKINYQKGIADALNCQGIYYMSDNDYLSAKLFNDALKIYRSLGDTSNEAQLLMNIGVLMYINHNTSEALHYIYQANNISQNLVNDSIRSIILSDIITLDNRLSDRSKDSIYQKGLSIARKYNDIRMIVSFENNQGTMLYNLGQKQKGIEILLGSLRKADSIGCEYIKVAAYMTLGEMMLDQAKEKEAITYYQTGLQISEKYGYPERYLMLAERLYNLYKDRNMPEKAYTYAAFLLSKHNSMANNLKKSGYGYLSYVLKENELAQSRKDDEIQTNLILMMSCFLLLIVLVLFFVCQSLLNKKKLMSVQKELNIANEQQILDMTNEAEFKDMLISVIAHDIRQPFSCIATLTNILSSPDYVTELEKKEILAEFERISLKAMAFMDGVLSWIKSRKDESSLTVSLLNVKSILLEASSFFSFEQSENEIKLVIEVADDVTFSAHRQMILFVFRNLFNNATKFSKRGGEIKVSFTRTDDFVTIIVADDGQGMTVEEMSELFKPRRIYSNEGGAGLALSISKDMVQKMRGKIWAESEPMQGATFFVSLPVLS